MATATASNGADVVASAILVCVFVGVNWLLCLWLYSVAKHLRQLLRKPVPCEYCGKHVDRWDVTPEGLCMDCAGWASPKG